MKGAERRLKENLQFVPSQTIMTLVFLIFLLYLSDAAVQCPSVCLSITNFRFKRCVFAELITDSSL